ncbi:MMPL family protein [Mycobacterium xenopi 4042]|uniref:MMPL family protein n=1 Tax=Mycobacterium xenopi 4042 TaxID=1299334 RepID=X8EEC8_MYCXE|nr:MMPL family protein [Mycobacterium xenopi 4042]
MYLAGNQGESLANESVEAIQSIIKNNPPPPGIHVYATGAAPLLADQHIAGDRSLKLITSLTFLVIIVMLLFVYRSIVTVLIVMAMVFLELAVAAAWWHSWATTTSLDSPHSR